MKKITKITVAFLFSIGFAQVASAQSTYTIKSSNGANLRQSPATGKEVLATMPAGAKVKVVEKTNDDWYKVEYNGKTGYVSSSLIEDQNKNTTSGSPKPSDNTSRNNTTAQSEQKSPAAKNTDTEQKNNNKQSSNSKNNSGSKKSVGKSGSSSAYNWGIGLRLGEPTGISLKKYNMNSSAWEFNLGRSSRWGYHLEDDDFYSHSKYENRDNYYYYGYKPGFTTSLQVRYLLNKPISGMDGLNFYYGAGAQMRFTPITYYYYYNADSWDNNDWWNNKYYRRQDRVTDIDLGVDGVLGLEYTLKDLPISFFLDANLFVEIVDAPFMFSAQGGAGVRYNF